MELFSNRPQGYAKGYSSATVRKATRKGKKRQLLTPTTFSLIHSTDFADRYERQILPLLNAGYIVLADRYIFTAFARDAVRGCDRGWIRKLYSFARKPDLTFYFDVPLKTALARRNRRSDPVCGRSRSEEHTSELQSPCNLVCRLLLEKKKKINIL